MKQKMRFIEEETAPGLTQTWHLCETVFETTTPFQEVVIARGAQGLTLFCGRERQSSELSQQIYHEGQWFPAALLTDTIDRVLIIGSSEGVITQMAKKSGAREVVHVDIDAECVLACAKYLPYGYSEAEVSKYLQNDDGVRLIFQDGIKFVEACIKRKERFDIIVMDLPDEQITSTNAQQNRLYSKSFLKKLKTLLNPKGTFITQAGCPTYWRNRSLLSAWQRINKVFKGVAYFEMEEQNWAWIVGGNFNSSEVVKKMRENLPKLKLRPKFIDETSIQRATVLPISIRKNL